MELTACETTTTLEREASKTHVLKWAERHTKNRSELGRHSRFFWKQNDGWRQLYVWLASNIGHYFVISISSVSAKSHNFEWNWPKLFPEFSIKTHTIYLLNYKSSLQYLFYNSLVYISVTFSKLILWLYSWILKF